MSAKPAPTKHHRYVLGGDDDDHEAYTSIGVDGLLAASEKLLAVSRGLASPDDRDAAFNDRIYTPDRLMAERFKLDKGKVLRTTMGRLARARTLAPLAPDTFSEYTVGYLKGNPLAPVPEQINPMHLLEQRRRITRMGPGGIGDTAAITTQMQSVHASQFGFTDPIAGPESELAGVDERLAYGARVGNDGRLYQVMRNARTGQDEWVSPTLLKGKIIKLPD